MVFPPVQLLLPAALPLVLSTSSAYGQPPLPAALARDWCRDVLAAVGHCVGCGVYLRYLPLEQVAILPTGRVVLCGLGGAVWATNAAVADREKDKDGGKEGKGGKSSGGDGGGGGGGSASASFPSLVTTAPEVSLQGY